MPINTAEYSVFKGIIIPHINTLWDFTERDAELFKKVLIKLTDDSVTAADFSKFCERCQTDEYFISTLKKLRKLAFPNEESISALNAQYESLEITIFGLKSNFSMIISSIITQLESGESYLISGDYDSETTQRVGLIKAFLDIETQEHSSTLEQKDIPTAHSNVKWEILSRVSDTLAEELVSDSGKHSVLSSLLNRWSPSNSKAEQEALNKEIRAYLVDPSDRAQGLDFSNRDLTGLDLRDLDLARANFSHAILCEVILTGASLIKSDFTGADLRKCSFDDETQFDYCKFTHARLDREVLEILAKGAKIPGNRYDLNQIDIACQDLSELDLTKIDFSGSNCCGADFTDALVEQSDFTHADLSKAKNVPRSIVEQDIIVNEALVRDVREVEDLPTLESKVGKQVSFFREETVV